MKLYYKALTPEGVRKDGIIDALDPKAAANYLRRQNLILISITEKSSRTFFSILSSRNRFNNNDLVFFTRQISSMIASGLTLVQALTVMKNQIKKQSVSEVVTGIISLIEEGSTFSHALSQYPEVFSPIYIALIQAAESSGLMDKVLARLADNLEKSQKLRQTIKSTLMYPAVVVTMMVLVVGIMMVFVIPNLKGY